MMNDSLNHNLKGNKKKHFNKTTSYISYEVW